MTETETLRQELELLRAERDALRSRADEAAAQVESLNLELAETNHGVVALYAELDDKAEQLKQASDLKSRFLSYMSHEFRTPLGSILSIVRVLLDRMDGPLTEEQEKQIQFIRRSTTELSEMVDDLLDLAKVEAGRIAISPGWFEMVDLFSALRGMFKPILTTDAVDLIFEESDAVQQVFSDNKKLSQILRNYISNALKFTTKGEVRVRATPAENDHITFSVSDTGIGIAAEHITSVFRDFVQIDSAIQKRLRGTGLGLSLSKKYAELLGGRVGVTSELGVGSTFTVTIPLRLPGHSDHREDSAPEGGGDATK